MAAYHVAGHALIAWRLGWLPATIEFSIPKPEEQGACPCHAQIWLPRRPRRSSHGAVIQQFYRSAAQLYHGAFIAQAMVDPGLRDPGASDEHRFCTACAQVLANPSGRAGQAVGVDDETVRIVCKHAQGIERFANALLEEPVLSATLADDLFRVVAGRKRRRATRPQSLRDELGSADEGRVAIRGVRTTSRQATNRPA